MRVLFLSREHEHEHFQVRGQYDLVLVLNSNHDDGRCTIHAADVISKLCFHHARLVYLGNY